MKFHAGFDKERMIYAGLFRRSLAFLIDLLIVLLAVTGYLNVINDKFPSVDELKLFLQAQDGKNPANLIIYIAWGLYSALFESSRLQATAGKKILGIYVADLEGKPISFLRATGRYYARILSFCTFFIGCIMMIFTGRKQSLHDLIARTLVLRGKPKEIKEKVKVQTVINTTVKMDKTLDFYGTSAPAQSLNSPAKKPPSNPQW